MYLSLLGIAAHRLWRGLTQASSASEVLDGMHITGKVLNNALERHKLLLAVGFLANIHLQVGIPVFDLDIVLVDNGLELLSIRTLSGSVGGLIDDADIVHNFQRRRLLRNFAIFIQVGRLEGLLSFADPLVKCCLADAGFTTVALEVLQEAGGVGELLFASWAWKRLGSAVKLKRPLDNEH